MPNILVFTATYGDGPRPETVESVEAQRTKRLAWVHEVSWHNPSDDPMTNVLAQYTRARALVLEGDYDALLTVEHDMRLVERGTLQRLWDTDAGVVYAPYLLRHGLPSLNTWQHRHFKNLGHSLSLYPEELARYRAAKTGPVCGVGFGCTLIRRAVLERIAFRGHESQACDIPFAQDCMRKQIAALGRFDTPCDHWDGTKWLVPYQEGSELTRVRMLRQVGVYKPGRYYTRQRKDALALVENGDAVISGLETILVSPA